MPSCVECWHKEPHLPPIKIGLVELTTQCQEYLNLVLKDCLETNWILFAVNFHVRLQGLYTSLERFGQRLGTFFPPWKKPLLDLFHWMKCEAQPGK